MVVTSTYVSHSNLHLEWLSYGLYISSKSTNVVVIYLSIKLHPMRYPSISQKVQTNTYDESVTTESFWRCPRPHVQ